MPEAQETFEGLVDFAKHTRTTLTWATVALVCVLARGGAGSTVTTTFAGFFGDAAFLAGVADGLCLPQGVPKLFSGISASR